MAILVDSYSETNVDADATIRALHPSSGVNRSARGQTFTGTGYPIVSCKFYLKRTGSPGYMTARVYAHSGTWGTSGVPTGAVLASSTAVNASGISDSYALVAFTFDGTVTLTDGTKYCLTLESSSGTWDTSNLVSQGSDQSSPSHGGNEIHYNSSAWGYQAWDQAFYVYGQGLFTVTITDSLGMLEVVPASKAAIKKAVSDILGPVDSQGSIRAVFQTVTDNLGMLEVVPASKAAIKKAVSDILGPVDSASPVKVLALAVADILGLRDRIDPRRRGGKIGDLPDDTITGGA
jgi:hypothetical protein